jgi:hypothetical protein
MSTDTNKRYTIVITEHSIEEVYAGQEWKQGAGDEDSENGYGYTPEIIKKKVVQRELYQQNTDELDLGLVIKAVNKF